MLNYNCSHRDFILVKATLGLTQGELHKRDKLGSVGVVLRHAAILPRTIFMRQVWGATLVVAQGRDEACTYEVGYVLSAVDRSASISTSKRVDHIRLIKYFMKIEDSS
jgi:hypothetical protein